MTEDYGKYNAAKLLRQMGVNADDTGGTMLTKAEQALNSVLAAAKVRIAHKFLDIALLAHAKSGADIERHLQGAQRCLVMALTLGAQVDALLRQAAAVDVEAAYYLDAAASFLIEEKADEFEAGTRLALRKQGQYLSRRFSPGYGDYDISCQPALLELCDAARRAGIRATEQFLLSPRKSITAVCAVADKPIHGTLAGCENCVLKHKCDYRKRGEFCFV